MIKLRTSCFGNNNYNSIYEQSELVDNTGSLIYIVHPSSEPIECDENDSARDKVALYSSIAQTLNYGRKLISPPDGCIYLPLDIKPNIITDSQHEWHWVRQDDFMGKLTKVKVIYIVGGKLTRCLGSVVSDVFRITESLAENKFKIHIPLDGIYTANGLSAQEEFVIAARYRALDLRDSDNLSNAQIFDLLMSFIFPLGQYSYDNPNGEFALLPEPTEHLAYSISLNTRKLAVSKYTKKIDEEIQTNSILGWTKLPLDAKPKVFKTYEINFYFNPSEIDEEAVLNITAPIDEQRRRLTAYKNSGFKSMIEVISEEEL